MYIVLYGLYTDKSARLFSRYYHDAYSIYITMLSENNIILYKTIIFIFRNSNKAMAIKTCGAELNISKYIQVIVYDKVSII